jgi:tetratricopeptide (TPR) repeat protein
MKKLQLYLLGIIFLGLLPIGCSVKKDKRLNRSFHWVTARYNKYYNAKVMFDEKLATYQEQVKDDYDQILTVKKIGSEEESKALFAPFETVIEKCNQVVSRHSMKIKGEEKNDWMDETFILLGQAYFYRQEFDKASQIFSHAKKYENLSKSTDLKIWAAETHVMLGNYTLAEKLLEEIVETDFLKKHHKIHILEARTELFKRDGYLDKAYASLEKTIKYLPNKGDHTGRNFFILGQLALERDDLENANIFFYESERRSKSYEMTFQAVLAQAKAYHPDFSIAEEIFASLNKLENQTANADKIDQIFYAKGQLYQKLEDFPLALENYQASIDTSTNNTRQLAKSHLAKGDLEFSLQNYEIAQQHYDEAMNLIDETFPNFLAIEKKWKSLSELAAEYKNIENLDSLLIVADWDKDKQLAYATSRAYRTIAEEEAKKKAKEELLKKLEENNISLEENTNTNNWYFTNSELLAKGRKLFSAQWGTRQHEDHWRRANKGSIDQLEEEEVEENEDEENDEVVAINDSIPENVRLLMEEILSSIPTNANDRKAMIKEIEKSYYSLGMIYKEQLQDYPESKIAFLKLLKKYPNTSYKVASYYHLYRILRELKQNPQAEKYKKIILEKHPDTIYASLLKGEYKGDETINIAETTYERYFGYFKNKEFQTVIDSTAQFIITNPESEYKGQMALLNAEALGYEQGRDSYLAALQQVAADYADSPIGEAAANKYSFLTSEESEVNTDIYNATIEGKYYVVLMMENNDSYSVETFISDFNKSTFSKENLKSTAIIFNGELKMVSVKLFNNVQDAYKYIGVMEHDQSYPKFKTKIKHSLVVSTKNYSLFYQRKNIEEYKEFMNKTLLPHK